LYGSDRNLRGTRWRHEPAFGGLGGFLACDQHQVIGEHGRDLGWGRNGLALPDQSPDQGRGRRMVLAPAQPHRQIAQQGPRFDRIGLVGPSGYIAAIVIAMSGWLWLLFECAAWCLGFN